MKGKSMRKALFLIIFFVITTPCFSGIFHAKDGTLIIDSLVKRWKYLGQNEIIDSLKKTGVKITVEEVYKLDFAELTKITIEKATFNQLYEVKDLTIEWSILKSKGKLLEKKSTFSFTVPNVASNVKPLITYPTLHPYRLMILDIIMRYGQERKFSHEHVTRMPGEGQKAFLRLLEEIRKQDEDMIKKDKIFDHWVDKVTVKGKEYIYSIDLFCTYDNLLEFTCSWSTDQK